MNDRIIRPELMKRIYDLTKGKGQRYTQEDIYNIVMSFFDVIIDAIRKGDSVCLNGYITIENQYMKSRKARNVAKNIELVVPEHYRVRIRPGSKLNQAVTEFSKKQMEERHE